jgi:fluoride exporter
VKQLILVTIGGGIGAVVRWQIGSLILHQTANWKFPIGTFIINVAGCMVAGLLAGLVIKQEMFEADTRLFMFTGLLGGFTTFSAFGIETVYLIRRQEYMVALSYVLLSIICGITGLWLAISLIRDRNS